MLLFHILLLFRRKRGRKERQRRRRKKTTGRDIGREKKVRNDAFVLFN